MSKKYNFKVGDKVRVKKSKPAYFNSNGLMDKYVGQVVTIHTIPVDHGFDVWDEDNKRSWRIHFDDVEPINECIVIYRKDREVIALDKRTGNKAVAKCCPEDTFDFDYGAVLALSRLSVANKPPKEGYFKMLCVGSKKQIYAEVGKVYEFVEGYTEFNKFTSCHYKNFEDYARRNPETSVDFVEIKEGDNIDEIKKKYLGINIGDTVKVISTGGVYSTYVTWHGLGRWKQNFVKGKLPKYGDKYKVLNIAPHSLERKDIVLIQDPDTSQVFIIAMYGIERV